MLDADDWLRFDALQIFYNFLEKNKKFNYVYSNIHLADEKRGILKKNYNFFEQLFTNQIPYCIFFRTKIFDNDFRYDENMKKGFEDWDLNIRLGAKGDFGKCLNKNLFNYNVSKQGMLLNNTLSNYSQIFRYIRIKNEKIYRYSSIIKNFFKWKNKKSNYNLTLLFFYRIILSLLNDNSLNFFFRRFYKYSISNLMQIKEVINFKSIEKANKILHVITSLDVGGAEKALYLLIKNTKKNINHEVICLKSEGFFYKSITISSPSIFKLSSSTKEFRMYSTKNFAGMIL